MWRGYKNALSLLPIENVAQGRQAARNVAPSASVLRAVVDMVKWRQGSLVVRDGESGPILGTITERDVLERVDPVAGAMRAARVEQIMTPREELATAAPSLALGQCMRLMQPGFRQLPIVDGERVHAVISIRDVALHMATALTKAPMHDPPAVGELMQARGAPGCVELIDMKASLAAALSLMRSTRVGSVLVTGGGEATADGGGAAYGVLTERDYITKAAVYDDQDAQAIPVAEVMSSSSAFMRVGPQGRLADCLSLMAAGGHRHQPVLSHGRVEGVISMREVLAFYLDFESEPEPDEDDLYDLFEADERYE